MSRINTEHDTTFMQIIPRWKTQGKHTYYLNAHRTFSDHDTTLSLESLSSGPKTWSPSIFSSHQLKADHAMKVDPVRTQPFWIPWVILACLILLAWSQVFYAKRIRQLFRAPFSQRFTNQLVREGNLFNERISLTFGVVYILSLSLLIFEINFKFLKLSFPLLDIAYSFPFIAIALSLFLSVKFLLIQFLSMVFKTRETTANYMLNLWVYSLIMGPFILAILIAYITTNQNLFLFAGISIIMVFLLFRLSKGFVIGTSLTKFSYLFLFVYLCSLEILPLIIVAKTVLLFAQRID